MLPLFFLEFVFLCLTKTDSSPQQTDYRDRLKSQLEVSLVSLPSQVSLPNQVRMTNQGLI